MLPSVELNMKGSSIPAQSFKFSSFNSHSDYCRLFDFSGLKSNIETFEIKSVSATRNKKVISENHVNDEPEVELNCSTGLYV